MIFCLPLIWFLSMAISRSVDAAAYGVTSLLWLSNIPLCVCTTAFLSTPVSGRSGFLPVLSIVNSAAVNLGVHVSL